jgi:hypothetical protein
VRRLQVCRRYVCWLGAGALGKLRGTLREQSLANPSRTPQFVAHPEAQRADQRASEQKPMQRPLRASASLEPRRFDARSSGAP